MHGEGRKEKMRRYYTRLRSLKLTFILTLQLRFPEQTFIGKEVLLSLLRRRLKGGRGRGYGGEIK